MTALPLDLSENGGHGKTESGDRGCCRASSGPFDCQACLHEVMNALLSDCDKSQAAVIRAVLSALQAVGSKGLSKDRVVVSTSKPFEILESNLVQGNRFYE